jgi:hypothetical protein
LDGRESWLDAGHVGWRSGTHAVLGQEPGDRGLSERSLEPAHRPAATGARVEIGAKNVTEKPGPTVAWWGRSSLEASSPPRV